MPLMKGQFNNGYVNPHYSRSFHSVKLFDLPSLEIYGTKRCGDRYPTSSRRLGKSLSDSIPMIASENILSPLVRKACNSDLHGRYAEGLPGKRYYQGCDDFDTIEEIGIKSAMRVFNCNFANIQSPLARFQT